MANVVFQCDVNRSILKRIDGKVKSLYLEISDTMITGKGIIYLESSRNEYSGDIDYEIKSITAVEKSMYEGVEALIIYVRVRSLYGAQKVQVRLPGLRELPRALNMLNDLVDANHPALAAASSAPAPAPVPVTSSEPASAAPAASSGSTAATPAPAPAPTPVTPAAPAPAPAPASSAYVSPVRPTPVTPAPAAPAPAPAPVTPIAPITPTPSAAPAPAPASAAPASVASIEEYKKKLEKLEAIYQTGMITEKEYKSSKAEYISALNGLDAFFNKVKVNLQYSEVGFLSADEFEAFKKSTIEECSELSGVPNDVLKQNLKKLLMLNLFEIVSDEEYGKICTDITKSVQYVTNDPEDEVVDKVEKWPILKDCEIISEAQYEQFVKLVADDTKIRMNESLPVLEHKLTRLSTLSRTFLFTPEEFGAKKAELVDEMTTVDFSSEAKTKNQINCIMILKNCGWINDSEFQTKKIEIVRTVESNPDIIARLQQLQDFVSINFITQDEYKAFEKSVIDEIFQQYSDISELQKKAQNLMNLKEAGIISEEDFNAYKKKLLAIS